MSFWCRRCTEQSRSHRCGQRLLLREAERLSELVLVHRDAHALPAAAGRRLHEHRKPDLGRDLEAGVHVLDRAGRAGHRRHLELLGQLARGGLVAHLADLLARGADEGDVGGADGVGKFAVLGEEPITRVEGVGAGDLGRRDEPGDVEVGVPRRRSADAHVVVREAHVQRLAVRLRVHGHGAEAELLARADDPQGDLPAVRDQDFFEHQGVRSDCMPPTDAPVPEPPKALLAAESTPETLRANSLGLVA